MTIPFPPPTATADYNSQVREGGQPGQIPAASHPMSPVTAPAPLGEVQTLPAVEAGFSQDPAPAGSVPAGQQNYFTDSRYPHLAVVVPRCGNVGEGLRVVVECDYDARNNKRGFAAAIELLMDRSCIQLAQMYAQSQGVASAGVFRSTSAYPVDAQGRDLDGAGQGAQPAKYQREFTMRATSLPSS